MFAAVAIGPLAAMIVGAVSMATLPIPVMRCAAFSASRAVTGALTGLTVLALPPVPGGAFPTIVIATLAAALVAQVLDALFVGLLVLLRGAHPLEIFRGVLPAVLVSAPLNATITAPITYVFLELSTWSVLFFVAPAVVAQRLFLLYQEQRELASNLTIVNARLERANLSFARSLVTALDARDHYAAGHSAAVAIYARDIASTLSLSEEDQATTHLAGLLHDIGKVGLPPGILEKPGALTPEERTQMQEHSAIGERILRNVEDYAEIATFVRHHHERVDGKGYPDGLQRDHIPLISRVLCVADAYNAMTSGRPYRAAMPTKEARQRLIDAMGTQFDEDVVVAFEHVLAHATDLYSLGASADFALEARAHRELDVIAEPAAA